MHEPPATLARTPLRDGLLIGPLDQLDKVRLAASRCSTCGEVSLGQNSICPNCGRDRLETFPLSERGSLWSFTIIRHRPPGDYGGISPFEPFGLGLIELPDGLRVLSPIEGDIASLKIGMMMRFKAYARQTSEAERVVFTFEPLVLSQQAT